MEVLKGRIVEIERNVHQAAYLLQGISKDKQWMYDNAEGVYGGNGSYVTGFEYNGTSIDVKIFVYDLEKCHCFDIRDYILRCTNKSKVSKKRLEYIVKHNKGKKVKVKVSDNKVIFDMSQLDVQDN